MADIRRVNFRSLMVDSQRTDPFQERTTGLDFRRNRMILQNKVALVTGGTSGIGRATAIAYAQQQAKVVVVDRRIDEGEETVKNAGGGITRHCTRPARHLSSGRSDSRAYW
jgi:FlaA1/EpsC-like NDP-sugar epimerase